LIYKDSESDYYYPNNLEKSLFYIFQRFFPAIMSNCRETGFGGRLLKKGMNEIYMLFYCIFKCNCIICYAIIYIKLYIF